MILDLSVTVQSKSATLTTEGMLTLVWTASQTTETMNKQPLSGEIAFKEYGISEAGITNVFFANTSTTADEGGRIVDADGTYDIYRIEKYPNHYEIIVRPVVS